MGWTYASHNPFEPESFNESYPSGVLPDNIITLQLHRKWEVNEMICIEEVGVDLNFVFMPMDTM